MREARPLDLNYGHLGEPVYDSEHKIWHFGRVPQLTQQFRRVGKPTIAHGPSLINNEAHYQSAAERLRNVKDLTQEHPELLPSSYLLAALAQSSETINELTSAHDPTVSDLLACGRAIDVGLSHHSNTIPIIAIAGGEGGELVRLISLTQEHLGWTESKNVYLRNLSCKKGEEAQWLGNGSPIKQLVFAESGGRPTCWLAARYHGAISILRPQLKRNFDTWNTKQTGVLSSRLDPGHIITFSAQSSQRSQFADVAFNPWYQQQIATIDQEGCWTVRNFERLISQKALWKIKEVCSGGIFDGHATDVELPTGLEDGWGAVLWAGDVNRLVVARRNALAVYDLKDGPSRVSMPDLSSGGQTHQILDIRRSYSATSKVYIVTSLSLHLLRIPTSGDASGSNVQLLLSWRHFRDSGDISLRLNLLMPSEDTTGMTVAPDTVLLYSRVTGVTTTYKFRCPTSSSVHAISTSDPSLFTIQELEAGTRATSICLYNHSSRTRISALALSIVPYGFYNTGPPSGLGQLYVGKNATFYQLRILFNDLSVSECLYSESEATPDLEIHPPDTRIRKERLKTTERVFDEFIVQDGIEEGETEDFSKDISELKSVKSASPAESQSASADSRNISLERLDEDLHNVDLCDGEAFELVLEHLRETIEEMNAGESPHLQTLHGLVATDFSVSDIDKASDDFRKFLGIIGRFDVRSENEMELNENKNVFVTCFLIPLLQDALNLKKDTGMSEVHDSLVQTWITSLSYEIPSRTRMDLERKVRKTSARISLANHAVSFGPEVADEVGPGDTPIPESGTQYSLPVRRRASVSSFSKSRKAAARSSSPFSSSQVSEDVGFLPPPSRGALPTPEPTPSLHSRSSISSLTAPEDHASIYLRAYTSIAPQPALPTKFSNKCLGHWGTVADPNEYDWEVTQQLFASDDEDQAVERVKQWERAQKRQKRRRGTTDGPSSQSQPRNFGGSQPPQMHDETGGSSQATPAIASACQPEPGRFGGRDGRRKKKRSLAPRAAGFK